MSGTAADALQNAIRDALAEDDYESVFSLLDQLALVEPYTALYIRRILTADPAIEGAS